MTWYLLLVVAATAACSYLLTAWARRIAPRLGLVDRPDGGRKRHAAPMPAMGGLAMFVAIITATVSVSCLPWWPFLTGPLTVNPGLLVSAALMCGLGVCDDRWGLRPRTKLVGQVLACLPFAWAADSISSIHFLAIDIRLGVMAPAFTVFWLVACANVINLADGLDGLAGSICLIATATLAVLAGGYARTDACLLALIAAGAIFGFLVHNWPPAKIFMGDAGSLTLGFLIGALAMESRLKQAAGFMLAVPLVLISIPVFDTMMAIVRRKLSGRGISEADRGHIHHRLQDRGLSRTQALLALVGMCGAMAAVTIVSIFLHNDFIAVGVSAATLGGLIVARIFGDHELRLVLRHLQALGGLIADSSGMFRSRMLLARLHTAESLRWQDYWDSLCRRVADMGGEQVEFVGQRMTDRYRLLEMRWQAPAATHLTPAIDRRSEEPRSESGPTTDSDRPSHWQFQYTAQRGPDLQLSVTAHGVASGVLNRQRFDDLFRWFDTICRCWPVDESADAALSNVEAPSILAIAPSQNANTSQPQPARRAA